MAPLGEGDRQHGRPLHALPSEVLDIGDLLALLLATGHSREDIFFRQNPGVPYVGWSYRQFEFWSRRSQRLYTRAVASGIDIISGGIGSVFDKKTAKMIKDAMERTFLELATDTE